MTFLDRLFVIILLSLIYGAVLDVKKAVSAEPHFRVSAGAEVLHAQGFSNLEVRYGNEWGIRIGAILEPLWLKDVDDKLKQASRNFQLDSTMYYAVDREWCGERWCGTLGLMHIAETSKINGTHWNFLLGIRYQFNPLWSVEWLHGSHGTMFGIKVDKANVGWNFIQLGRSF